LPRIERLGILLGLVVVGLGLSPYVRLPSPLLSIHLPGALSPIAVTLTPALQISLVVTLLVCAAVDGIVCADRRLAGAGFARSIPYWVLPAFVTLGAFAVSERLSGPLWQVLGPVLAAALLGLLVVTQLHTIDPSERWFEGARLGLNVVSHGLALVVFINAYRLPARNVVAPAAVGLVSTALALELLATRRASDRRIWGSALVVGLVMAQVGWALSMGILSPLATGILLFLIFYGVVTAAQQRLWGRLRAQAAVELAIAAAVALVLIVRFGA
jgi:hypothetical protein